jgi:hypothetical protein
MFFKIHKSTIYEILEHNCVLSLNGTFMVLLIMYLPLKFHLNLDIYALVMEKIIFWLQT